MLTIFLKKMNVVETKTVACADVQQRVQFQCYTTFPYHFFLLCATVVLGCLVDYYINN
jgi:hypothetical protein